MFNCWLLNVIFPTSGHLRRNVTIHWKLSSNISIHLGAWKQVKNCHPFISPESQQSVRPTTRSFGTRHDNCSTLNQQPTFTLTRPNWTRLVLSIYDDYDQKVGVGSTNIWRNKITITLIGIPSSCERSIAMNIKIPYHGTVNPMNFSVIERNMSELILEIFKNKLMESKFC